MTIAKAIHRSMSHNEVVAVHAANFGSAWDQIKAVWQHQIGWAMNTRDDVSGYDVWGYRGDQPDATTDWRLWLTVG